MEIIERHTKGLGDATVYLRILGAGRTYYNFVTTVYVASEAADCKIFGVEMADSSVTESDYLFTHTPPSGGYKRQIVDSTDNEVIYEDTIQNVGGLTGAHTVTIQFYRTATVTPIPDVLFDVYDSTETVRANGTQFKSAINGQMSFARDNGTYKVRAMLAGFTFTTGTVAVNGADVTLIMYGDAAAADAPIPVGAIRVHDYCFQADGVTPMPTADVSGKMRIIELPYDYNGRLHSGKVVSGTYNVGTGKLYWDIAPGALCEFSIRHAMPDGEPVEKRVPLTAAGNEIRLEDIP